VRQSAALPQQGWRRERPERRVSLARVSTIPSLPGADADPRGRAEALARAKDELTYAWDRPAGVAMASAVPKRLGYPLAVLAEVAKAEAQLLANRAAVRLSQGLHATPEETPSTIDSSRALFKTIAEPAVAALSRSGMSATAVDRAFAWQRVAGANPFVITRIDRVPDHFAVDDDALARAVAGDSRSKAAAEGRLFLADYVILDGLPAGPLKQLSAPLALFVRAPGGKELLPVAIQCAQRPDRGSSAITPRDGVAWQMARVVVQVADANVQESFQHLGRAHFLLEAFGMAMERQLSARHPLFVLLSPHLHGTLAINGAARDQLVVPGGQLDTLLAPTLEASLTLVRQGLSTMQLPAATFANDLRSRGVESSEVLPDYPFRDDGALIHAAIDELVGAYVRIAYASDAEVLADVELRAFIDELRSESGGRLAGVPARIDSIASLIELVSFVVFSASARHAALNYSQGDFMGWAPNMPTAGYAPPPTAAMTIDEATAWSSMLAPQGVLAKQLEFMWQQSQIRADRLGRYPLGHFLDPRVEAPLARFRAALDEAERQIAERELTRFLPYPYLSPSALTASIHI
jgi:arachidonate 15-lipoxygenase